MEWNFKDNERTRLADIKIVCHKFMKYIKYKKSIFFHQKIHKLYPKPDHTFDFPRMS